MQKSLDQIDTLCVWHSSSDEGMHCTFNTEIGNGFLPLLIMTALITAITAPFEKLNEIMAVKIRILFRRLLHKASETNIHSTNHWNAYSSPNAGSRLDGIKNSVAHELFVLPQKVMLLLAARFSKMRAIMDTCSIADEAREVLKISYIPRHLKPHQQIPKSFLQNSTTRRLSIINAPVVDTEANIVIAGRISMAKTVARVRHGIISKHEVEVELVV